MIDTIYAIGVDCLDGITRYWSETFRNWLPRSTDPAISIWIEKFVANQYLTKNDNSIFQLPMPIFCSPIHIVAMKMFNWPNICHPLHIVPDEYKSISLDPLSYIYSNNATDEEKEIAKLVL